MAKYIFLLLLGLSHLSSGQGLTGKVVDAASKQPIPYASVRLLNTNLGTICNEEGDFALANATLPGQLIVSELGHQGDTISVPTARVSSKITALCPPVADVDRQKYLSHFAPPFGIRTVVGSELIKITRAVPKKALLL